MKGIKFKYHTAPRRRILYRRDIGGVNAVKPNLYMYNTAMPISSSAKMRGVLRGHRNAQSSAMPLHYSCNQPRHDLLVKRCVNSLNSGSTSASVVEDEILLRCSVSSFYGCHSASV
ncbi:hypothetical protein MA16_Dca015588 [Dendrobium catenatum]|uniref:Uncharacterized protein n=1 Tax=Dendrobium catenatum TaxID=906689 RepID=A0A2I0WJ87_9ASPA|nr:hypothetical protein MA16_Dca015588 [Dendrobium catenatum]